jgi:hypothetical protein
MKRYYSGAHANRVRLSNGGWMSLRAYKETLAEMYPPEPTDPYADIDTSIASLEKQTASLQQRMDGLEALARARRDMTVGNLPRSNASKPIPSRTGFNVDITKMYEEEI